MQTQCCSPLTGRSLRSPKKEEEGSGGTKSGCWVLHNHNDFKKETLINIPASARSTAAFDIIHWPWHCRVMSDYLHQWEWLQAEQIIRSIHETGLRRDYSVACQVEDINWPTLTDRTHSPVHNTAFALTHTISIAGNLNENFTVTNSSFRVNCVLSSAHVYLLVIIMMSWLHNCVIIDCARGGTAKHF